MTECLHCRSNTAKYDSLYCGRCQSEIDQTIARRDLSESLDMAITDVRDEPTQRALEIIRDMLERLK